MTITKTISSLAAGVCLIGLFAGSAAAGELTRIVAGEMPTVRDRFDGLGLRAGQFWILPTVETGYFHDSNVFAEPDPWANSDSGIYVKPNVAVKSDFGRHELNLRVGADHYEYFNIGSQSHTNVDGELSGRIDVRSDLVVVGGLKGGKFQETIGELEYPVFQTTSPIDYYTFESWGSINKGFNRVSVSVGAAYKMYDYDDLGPIDQDFRDGHVVTVGGRVGYIISPGHKVFGDFRYNWRDYRLGRISDSDGWRALAGVEFEITRLVSGEVSVGYMEQYYNTFGTTSGWSYHAGLVWNPTMLATVSLDADRTVEDSALTGRGRIDDSARVQLDYEVLRTLLLSPSAGIKHVDYQGWSQNLFQYEAGVQLEYKVNRFLAVGSRYKYTYNDYDMGGLSDWDRHVVGVYAKASY